MNGDGRLDRAGGKFHSFISAGFQGAIDQAIVAGC